MARWKVRCPGCAEVVVLPDLNAACPKCGFREEPDDNVVEIAMPFLKTSGKTAATDKLYRDMERGSEIRAQAAADQLGVPVSEMSGLKMTDLPTGRKPGENSAPPLSVSPEFSQFTASNPNTMGFRGADGVGYSGAVQSGPAPNAGARMRTALQGHHAQISGGTAVSDRPALETTQPGYRRRG